MAAVNEMLDRECRVDIHRVLISNKADLKQARRMLAFEGMNLVFENGMHRYFEVSTTQKYEVTSIITDIIKTIHES